MRNILEIDGVKAVVSFDPELNLLRGEFLGLAGGADFYAASVSALKAEGKKSLKVFLDVCREKGIAPYRSFSGRFNVRLKPETHEAAVLAAAAADKSLNDLVEDAIANVAQVSEAPKLRPVTRPARKAPKLHPQPKPKSVSFLTRRLKTKRRAAGLRGA